jgi:hypothetical protein
VAGRREVEQEEALASGGGVGWRMQWREVGRVAGGRAGDMGSIGQDGGGGGVRVGRRDTQGQASGAGLVGRVGRARGDVGVRACGGAPGSVDRLDR